MNKKSIVSSLDVTYDLKDEDDLIRHPIAPLMFIKYFHEVVVILSFVLVVSYGCVHHAWL